MITLAVLAARHLAFAAPALLVTAATFTRALREDKLLKITTLASQLIPLP